MNSIMRFSKEDIVLTLWLFAALFYNTSSFKFLGVSFVMASVGVMLVFVFRTGITVNKTFILLFAGMLLVYFVAAMRNPTLASLKTVGLLFITIIAFFFFANANICHIHTKRLKFFIGIQLIILIIPLLLHIGINPMDGGFMSIYTTTTFLGIFSCVMMEVCILLFLYDKSKIWIFYCILYAYLIYEYSGAAEPPVRSNLSHLSGA